MCEARCCGGTRQHLGASIGTAATFREFRLSNYCYSVVNPGSGRVVVGFPGQVWLQLPAPTINGRLYTVLGLFLVDVMSPLYCVVEAANEPSICRRSPAANTGPAICGQCRIERNEDQAASPPSGRVSWCRDESRTAKRDMPPVDGTCPPSARLTLPAGIAAASGSTGARNILKGPPRHGLQRGSDGR